MSNCITVEMVQDELNALSELYSAKNEPFLARDIHANIRPTDEIEDLRDYVNFALVCHEDNFGQNSDEANFWVKRGYATSVAREIALGGFVGYGDFTRAFHEELGKKLAPKEYRGALRVGDTVSYQMKTELYDLWTVDRYRIIDATDTQLAKQVLFLERHLFSGQRKHVVVEYVLSPDAKNDVAPC